MRPLYITMVSLLLAVLPWPAAPVSAGKLYWHRQCTPTKCCLPDRDYGKSVWPFSTPHSFGATEIAVANAAVGVGDLRHLPFHFRDLVLTADHLTLDQVGLAIYETRGRLLATGRITHNGGDGGLIGSNVTIRIRAYVASSADPNQIPPDAVVVWKSERKVWISRNRPQHISLVPTGLHFPQPEELNRHFNQITHLEVELEYEKDR